MTPMPDRQIPTCVSFDERLCSWRDITIISPDCQWLFWFNRCKGISNLNNSCFCVILCYTQLYGNMKLVRDCMSYNLNIFDLPELPIPEEFTTILNESPNIRIERIISTGQTSDWFDQSETEFVVLIEGNAVIEYENGVFVSMSKGDTLLIESHERHRVCYTSSEPPCIWLCVFY